jgi:hypothetical protein
MLVIVDNLPGVITGETKLEELYHFQAKYPRSLKVSRHGLTYTCEVQPGPYVVQCENVAAVEVLEEFQKNNRFSEKSQTKPKLN